MASILEGIDSPEQVRQLSLSELEQLAAEKRERLITVLSNNGGHLGPNLGVVELTIALHYVFHTPSDSFLFDVSHQAYVHKLLTGRQDRFDTIRTPGGLNGFMLRTESPHDCYGAGHAGTALSAALGMAVARAKSGGNEHMVAVAGDAAFTCGITYEALNNIAHHTKRLIVVLNDNEWSIDKNVGAIASYLHKIVTSPRFDYLHERAGKLVEKVGGVAALRMARKAEEVAKGMLWPSVIFEELGLKYFGPIDGHDIATLIKTFEYLTKQDRPVLLHVLTQKGKGFEPAMQKQKKFHGLGPYDPETGETKPLGRRTYSELFADTMVKLADFDPKVVAITAAMPNGTGLDRFQLHHPDKYFDVGIAEILVRLRSEGGGHHRRHAQRHRSRPLPASSSGQVFRCRDRRNTCPTSIRRWWPSPPPCPTAPVSTASSFIIRTSISMSGSPKYLSDFDPKVVAITAAMPNGTGLDRFQLHHPDKYFDVGIAEILVRLRSEGGGHHSRHAQRHRSRPLPASSSGQVFRCRDRRNTCPTSIRRWWPS